MKGCGLTASITALANMLAKTFGDDELTLLSLALTQLGDTLATLVAQRSICANNSAHKPGSGGTNKQVSG